MRRVWVIGAGGSGKTTFAGALARRLGVPHVELDALHHGPNWAEPVLGQFRAAVAAELAADGWVVDGGYQHKLGDMVPRAADTIVWLDPPLHVAVRRMTTRTLWRLWHRTELWNGNRESMRAAFWGRKSLVWSGITQHRAYRRDLPCALASPELAGRRIVRLRTVRAAREWLAGV